MDTILQESADLFLENHKTVLKSFPWDDVRMSLICAMAYSSKGMKADTDRMKEANEILKKKAGIFSEFRGNTKLIMLVNMAQEDDMEAYFDRVQSVYHKLTAGRWLPSDHYVVAAMVIAYQNGEDSLTDDEYVERTKAIYAGMKKDHPLLTGEDDMGFAALLAVSDLKVDEVLEEMESCYRTLKDEKKFMSDNGLQSLSLVLALHAGNTKEKCDKVIQIYEALKENKKKFGTTYELSSLGCLAFTDENSRLIADKIAEVDDYLLSKRNFSLIGIDKKEWLMYAAILVMQQYCKADAAASTSVISSVVSLIIIEQIAMAVIFTSCMVTMTVSSGN